MKAALADPGNHSLTTSQHVVNDIDKGVSDYGMLLTEHCIEFLKEGSFLLVGSLPATSYCTIYLSVVRQQMPKLIGILSAHLTEFDVAYRIPDNSNIHTVLLDGGLGYDRTGKVVTIFAACPTEKVIKLASLLIRVTENLIGPDIPSAIHLGNCVYTDTTLVKQLESAAVKSPSQSAGKKNASFPELKFPKRRPSGRWLKRKFLLVETLKSDTKGNVYKALNFSKWSDLKWCVVKQGNRNQCYDDAGRTIKNRLQWQFELQSTFAEKLHLPKAIDFFELDGNCFFAMEYIPGLSLYDKLNILQQGISWFALKKEVQLQILRYLIKTAELIINFHACGLIHRDLSPLNFIVDDQEKVIPIDIELSYDYKADKPNPCYALGTAGYMSPGQSRMELPVIGDDSFGFGALLVRAFTGLSPTKFDVLRTERIHEALTWHIGSQRIVSIISSCFNDNADSRPGMISIRHNLELCQSLILTSTTTKIDGRKQPPEPARLTNVIEQCNQAIWQYPLISSGQKWYFKTEQEHPLISNEFRGLSWHAGFGNGTSGVIYMTALADHLGYDLYLSREVFYANLDYVLQYMAENNEAGLFKGAYGFCFVFASLIKFGEVQKSIENINLIADLLKRPTSLLNIADGLAGQGLAMIHCADLLNFPALRSNCPKIAAQICSLQNRDGSWSISKDASATKKVKHTGLFHGIAGIIYFLLVYATDAYDLNCKAAVIKGLNWLLKTRKLLNGCQVWPTKPKIDQVDPWLEYGFTGISFLFIRAYELLQDEDYKEAAISALSAHPEYIASNYLSHANGLAGLGEVYLEAYRVFKAEEWKNRASHIVSFLLHASSKSDEPIVTWRDGSETKSSPGFFNGHCGITHFLERYHNPNKIGMHFFSK